MPGSLPNPLSDPLAVAITGREIYDAVVRLTGRVDVLIEQHQATRQDVQDHETRLRQVEDVRPGPRLADLDQRVRQVEARLWPLPAASLLVAMGALAAALLPRLTG